MDGQQWIEEMRRTRKLLGELGHYISGPTPMRCQFCKVVAGILSINPLPCPKAPKSNLLGKR